MPRAVAWPMLTAETGIDRYFREIQRFSMLDPQEEYVLAKRWREDGDRDAAAPARHQSFAARRQDRQGLSRLRSAAR